VIATAHTAEVSLARPRELDPHVQIQICRFMRRDFHSKLQEKDERQLGSDDARFIYVRERTEALAA